jgi:hypothetical protein
MYAEWYSPVYFFGGAVLAFKYSVADRGLATFVCPRAEWYIGIAGVQYR